MSLPRICSGPLSRREFAKTLSVMLGGVYLHDVAPLRAMAARADRGDSDTAVILIWLPGGPPHLDMYDMKPQAPREYRGEFRPIPTCRAGARAVRVDAVACEDGRSVLRDPLGRRTSLPIMAAGINGF